MIALVAKLLLLLFSCNEKFKETKIFQVEREEIKKLQIKKLLYSFKRSFQLGNKKFRVIYTLH